MATEVFNINIIKDRLFFTILETKPKFFNSGEHWLHTDDIFDYLYFPFAFDFGPPSTAQVFRFAKTIDKLIKSSEKKIHFYSLVNHQKNTTNAVFLMGSYCILSMGWTSELTEERFSALHAFLEFYRDASEGPSTYGLSMNECFSALDKAKRLGWIDLETFDYQEYTFYEQVENGDFNWIIPKKFIAMCSPTATQRRTETTVTHTPDYYLPYFKKHGVSSIIRLNTPEYEPKVFTKAGIEHYDMYFVDGTAPPVPIVEKFLQVVETVPGVIAVHCKQGLGRTGSLIACYIMKHYDLTAAECIAFLRIQRPGSIVGPQQQFLHRMEPLMKSAKKKEGESTTNTVKCPHQSPKCNLSPVVTGIKKTGTNRTHVKVS